MQLPVDERGTAPVAGGYVLPAPTAPGEISLRRLADIVRRRWRTVAATCAIAVMGVLAITLLTPRTYSSSAQFMPQSRRGSANNLSGLAAQFGVAIPGLESGQSPQFYVDLIASRAILTLLADTAYQGLRRAPGGGVGRTAPLAAWYRIDEHNPALRRDLVVARLARDIVARAASTTGVVTMTVRAPDALLAEQIAARVLSLVDQFNREKRQSQAAAERAFTGRRVAEIRAELRAAEERLRQYQQANLGGLNAPGLRLEEDRLRQDVSLRQQLFSSMSLSYEQARIDEVRDTPLLTVLQQPEVPVLPDSRHLILKIALALTLGGLVGGSIAVLRETGTQA